MSRVVHLLFLHPGAEASSARCESLTARSARLSHRRYGAEDTLAQPYAGTTTSNHMAVTCKRCLAWLAADAKAERDRAWFTSRPWTFGVRS